MNPIANDSHRSPHKFGCILSWRIPRSFLSSEDNFLKVQRVVWICSVAFTSEDIYSLAESLSPFVRVLLTFLFRAQSQDGKVHKPIISTYTRCSAQKARKHRHPVVLLPATQMSDSNHKGHRNDARFFPLRYNLYLQVPSLCVSTGCPAYTLLPQSIYLQKSFSEKANHSVDNEGSPAQPLIDFGKPDNGRNPPNRLSIFRPQCSAATKGPSSNWAPLLWP